MSEELVKLEELGKMPVGKYGDDDWDETTSSSAFLPRVQLMTSNSSKCKSGEFPTNHYALIRDQKHDDLGKNIDVLVLAWRPKALETGEAVISVHDASSDEFKRIQEKSAEKNSGCMFGPEFLVWVPKVGAFATFFMGTISARREAGNVKARLRKPATFSAQLCKNKKYEWFAPTCSACSTPFDMPAQAAMVAAVQQFDNPPKNEVEGVAAEEETRAR